VRKIPRAVYLTADELDEVVAVRAAEADALSNDAAKHALLKEVAQLRVYAAAERWTEPPRLKSQRLGLRKRGRHQATPLALKRSV
jgi:hypothetical protein